VAAQKFVVRHLATALRLHLQQLQPAVDETRAPDDRRPSLDHASRPDVRREGANPVVQLLRRPRPVELSIGRPDLLGIGDAVLGLRRRPSVVERGVDQVGRQLSSAREEGSGVVVDPDRKLLLSRDRPGVELLDQLDDRDSCLLVARHQRPLDRRSPTPARQERRVDVEPARAL